MTQKQRIILKNINGICNRSIAKEFHISKNIVENMFLNMSNMSRKRQEILAINSDTDTEELKPTIVE